MKRYQRELEKTLEKTPPTPPEPIPAPPRAKIPSMVANHYMEMVRKSKEQ